MDDNAGEKRWVSGKALLIAIGALAFYVLSAGPSAWICKLTDPSGRGPLWRIGDVAYAPITHVVKATNTIDWAERYMKHFR